MQLNSSSDAAMGWLLRVKLGAAWEECIFESRGDALETAKALCDDYDMDVKDLKLIWVGEDSTKPSLQDWRRKHYQS